MNQEQKHIVNLVTEGHSGVLIVGQAGVGKSHILSHPWETVVQAAWRKYPNPMNPGVTGIDVTDRKVEPDGTLKSHRLLTTKWGLPGWAIKLVGMEDACYVSEHSEVNAQQKKMTLKSKNLTFSGVAQLEEHMEYVPHPSDPNKTCLKQESVITVQGVPLTSYMETLIVNSASANAHKGRQAMDWVCQKMKDEAVDLCRTVETTSADLRRNLETTSADLRRNLETTCKNIEDNMKTMETKFENMIPNNNKL